MVFFSTAIFLCKAQCSSTSELSNFASCTNLAVLNSTLYWNYNISSNTVEIAFRQSGIYNYSTWIAWAINPTLIGMIGAQAFVAHPRSDGRLIAYTSSITSRKTILEQGKLSFPVYGVSAIYANNSITIFATLLFSSRISVVNHVWQRGPMSVDNVPSFHGHSKDNLQSYGTLNFLSGETRGEERLMVMKKIHGGLNVIGWGIMLPLGVVIARYIKLFKTTDSAWFHIHVICQSLGYIVGIMGWTTGLNLGVQLSGFNQKAHGYIGICLFCLATAQTLFFFRPKELKYRKYWNIIHICIGYGTIILGISNVFIGINILKPGKKWKEAYISILALLGAVAVLLEIGTACYSYFSRKTKNLETTDGASPFNS